MYQDIKFNLKKAIVFFDIEATGLNVLRDRIVQIALIKYTPDGKEEELEMMINPGHVPISSEAMAVHGITPQMLSNKPTFDKVGEQLFHFIGNADLAGYNSDRFDIPMLMEEFARIGLELDISIRNTIDVQKIFYKMEPRTLSAAYRYFCAAELEGAHDALADVKATVDVLRGQLVKYDGVDYIDGDNFRTAAPIVNDMHALSEFTHDKRTVDVTMRMKYNSEGVIVFNFGKYIGKPVAETLVKDRQYLNWILEKDFSTQMKQIVRKLVKEYEAKQQS